MAEGVEGANEEGNHLHDHTTTAAATTHHIENAEGMSVAIRICFRLTPLVNTLNVV